MTKIKYLFILLLFTELGLGQEIEFLNGFELYYSKVESGGPNVSNKYINNDAPIYVFRYNHTFKKIKKFPIYAQFYTGRSWAQLEIGTMKERNTNIEGQYVNGIRGGSSRTQVYRFGLGSGYNFDFFKSRFRISPKLILNFEHAVETWAPGIRTIGETNGRYTFDTYSGSIPGNQIIPEFGIAFKIRCFYGLYLFTEYSYLQGHRPSQYIEAVFSIDGILQPKARNINDGTSHHIMWGLSYDFKVKKKKKKKSYQ